MSLLAYIPDGYNRNALVSAVPRLYPDVRFTYRPLLQRERSIVAAQANKAGAGKDAEVQVACVLRQLVAWDVADGEGVPLPLTLDSVGRLQPELLQRIYAIVLGLEGGDADVGAEPVTGTSQMVLLEAALSGTPTLPTQEELDAKN